MNKTPLNDKHRELNAKMVDYAGWDMPVQYEGIPAEVNAVRNHVGIFDVSHMGELRLRGPGVEAFLDWALTRPISNRREDSTSYAILCYEDGGVVDDLLVYQLGENDYFLVVNAANKDKDFAYFKEIIPQWKAANPEAGEVEITDESALYAQVAVQGPEAMALVEKTLPELGYAELVEAVLALRPFRRLLHDVPGEEAKLIISRTGYTGEDGVEIYLPPCLAPKFWDALVKNGAIPAGLGARDALRLEAGMPLYGHEMSQEINPLDANMGFAVKFDRPFLGEKMRENHKRKLIALISEGRGIGREGYEVYHNDEKVGFLTSGSFSPTLEKGIAFAMVDLDFPEDVKEVEVQIRKKRQAYEVVQAPFVKK
ncbi:MAG: glycine cleavage system aminomethyltransferase GcvT [Eubacteriales bacterium]|nr:glycine cleavage system aminomethyltransferase GcvT [Eubacteriales bacterium]